MGRSSGSFETSHVCSSAHTCCHFGSIVAGSYRSMLGGKGTSRQIATSLVAAAFQVAVTREPARRPSARAAGSVISAAIGCGPARPSRTRFPTW